MCSCSQFIIEPRGDRVSIKSQLRGTWLQCHADGTWRGDCTHVGDWEQFKLLPAGVDGVHVYSSHHDKYMCATPGGATEWRRLPSVWETLTIRAATVAEASTGNIAAVAKTPVINVDAAFVGTDHPQFGKLVFSHYTVTGASNEYFSKDSGEALSCAWNSLDRAPHKLSRLADLEQYRATDGVLHFTLVYPNLPTGAAVFRWKQFRCVHVMFETMLFLTEC